MDLAGLGAVGYAVPWVTMGPGGAARPLGRRKGCAMNLGPESETAEHKRSTSELKEGAASVAAILNKHERGELFFGVRNDGEVCGMQASDSTLREASQAIGHSIEPRVYPVVEALGDGEGRSCIRVSFSGDDAPHACKGVYPHARLGRGRPHERRRGAAHGGRGVLPPAALGRAGLRPDMRLSWRGISRRAGNQMGKA